MNSEQINRIIDEVIALGAYEICLTGGEALLHKDFENFVNRIKKNNVRASVITNGCFVEKNLHIIKMLDLVTVSLDGNEEDNDYMRGRGTYRMVIKALELIRETGVPCSIKVTLNRYNLNSFSHILDVAEKYGFMVSFGSLVEQIAEDSRDKLPSEELPDDVDYRNAVHRILDLQKKEKHKILNSPLSLKYFLNWPVSYKKSIITDEELIPLKNFKPIPCYAGRFFIMIDSDGGLYPCSTLINRVQSFNCIEMGVKKAMERALQHSCRACHFISNIDQNFLFSLNPLEIHHLLSVKRV
jgi:MoaA/NifB/PqqE/SkfB family radical SAM enzyme